MSRFLAFSVIGMMAVLLLGADSPKDTPPLKYLPELVPWKLEVGQAGPLAELDDRRTILH